MLRSSQITGEKEALPLMRPPQRSSSQMFDPSNITNQNLEVHDADVQFDRMAPRCGAIAMTYLESGPNSNPSRREQGSVAGVTISITSLLMARHPGDAPDASASLHSGTSGNSLSHSFVATYFSSFRPAF